MTRRILYILIALLSGLPILSEGKVWTVDEVPMVYLQDATRFVCNPENILSPAAVDSMDAILLKMRREKGIESVVVVVSQVPDGDCYEFGMGIARKYGVGNKKQNTGLIIVLSTEDRRYSILTGHGMEASLPDAICKRIEYRIMVPLLKKGDWDGAMLGGIKAISAYLDGDPSLRADDEEEDNIGDLIALLYLFFLTSCIVFALVYSRRKKCPQCGKRAYVRTAEKYLYTQKGYDYFQVVDSCRKCGYSHSAVVRRRHYDDNDDSGILSGAVLGSMMGGHGSHGGGFSGGFGGSFGGGSFGGGGASGGF